VSTTERPILFSAPMVRALLAGKKTQTRRAIKAAPTGSSAYLLGLHQPTGMWGIHANVERDDGVWRGRCPYGAPGDRLWVRETFAKIDGQTQPWIETDYRATYTRGDRLGDTLGIKKRWTPAIHMPRAASRITLEVTEIRVERLQNISEADARAEGVNLQPRLTGYSKDGGCRWEPEDPRTAYCSLWESINGPGSWESNPWVWVVSFKRAAP